MAIGNEILKYRDEIVRHTCEIVRIKSVMDNPEKGNPFGEGVGKALDYMLELGGSMGFKTRNVDGYAGHVEYGEGSEIAAVLVHLDVVPEGEGWSYTPYGGVVSDGRIYGRGVVDNKGPAVAALYSLKVLKDLGIKTKRRVRVIFGTNEENGMKDMEYYYSVEPVPDMGFSPDAAYPIYNREKGIIKVELVSNRDSEAFAKMLSLKGGSAANIVPESCEAVFSFSGKNGEVFKTVQQSISNLGEGCPVSAELSGDVIILTSKGRPSHGACPELGVNAISHLLDFLSSLHIENIDFMKGLPGFLNKNIGLDTWGRNLRIDCRDEVSGELTLNLGTIDQTNEYGKAVLDIRYPVTVPGTDIIEKIRSRAEAEGLSMNISKHIEPLYVEEDNPLIVKLKKAYRDITGEEAKLLSMGGGTYARTLRNNGVAFGGAEGENAHQADENVSIDRLMHHARICTQAVYEMAL